MAAPKKDEIYGYQTYHREKGYYIARLEQYERSVKIFETAVSKTPNDKRALVGRSIARAKANQYKGALEDIDRALQLYPDDLVMLAHKALETYLICEFEEALLQNSRLVPLRQKPENFAMGIMHCTDAIENCLGERTGRPLRDHFKIIRRLAWQKNADASKPYEPKPRFKAKRKSKENKLSKQAKQAANDKRFKAMHVKGMVEAPAELEIIDSLTEQTTDKVTVPPLAKPYPFRPLQRYTTNIENFMAEKYLGKMYLDKAFLKQLLTIPGISSPNHKGTKKLKQIARNGFNAVFYKQEVMRSRRPFYFIKHQEYTFISENLHNRQSRELEGQRKVAKREADGILSKLNEACSQKRIKLILELGEKLKKYCDTKSRKLLPDKDMYLANVVEKICNGFYDMFAIDESNSESLQERQILIQLGVIDMSHRDEGSLGSIMEEFFEIVVDHKKQLSLFEHRLDEANTLDEACWCYHELTRYNLEVKRHELVGVYARKCIQQAKRIRNFRWVINCIMLLARSNLQQRDKNSASNEIKEAKKIALELKDRTLDTYLRKCQTVIDDLRLDTQTGQQDLHKREKTIINILPTLELKSEITHMFREMAGKPANRRMTIMPGVSQD